MRGIPSGSSPSPNRAVRSRIHSFDFQPDQCVSPLLLIASTLPREQFSYRRFEQDPGTVRHADDHARSRRSGARPAHRTVEVNRSATRGQRRALSSSQLQISTGDALETGADRESGVAASVIIAAHNEAGVLGSCLDALLDGAGGGRLEVIVVPNGCTDATAAVAARHPGVRVIEIAVSGKAAALNAGESIATAYPRIYLDADITVPPEAAIGLAEALRNYEGIFAAVPARVLDTEGRPLLVRAYLAINQRLPAFQEGIFGRGMIALSASGRGRFTTFPLMVADDLFLDSLFTTDEKCTVPGISVEVAAPWRVKDLLKRLIRVRQGNTAMRAASRNGEVEVHVRPARRLAWLAVVLRRPWLAPAGVIYVAITVLAAILARVEPTDRQTWRRDDSSREHNRTRSSRNPEEDA
jgi:hypothetical protein